MKESFINGLKKSMTPFNDFNIWFIRRHGYMFDIVDKKDPTNVLGSFNELTDEKDLESSIAMYWDWYKKTRPEYLVGCIPDMSGFKTEDFVDLYKSLLVGCVLIREYKSCYSVEGFVPEDHMRQATLALNWLDEGDFYTAPASTRYHDAYSSGLLIHTINVYLNACDVWNLYKFKNVNPEEFTLCALVHDWCKIGLYESYDRNVKKNDVWVKERAFKWREEGPAFSFGHGVTSMFLASRFFRLSIEECAAIRWHMDCFNVADNEITDLQTSNEKYPLVHMLQFADKLSIVRY